MYFEVPGIDLSIIPYKIESALKIFISDFYLPDGTTAVRVMPTK